MCSKASSTSRRSHERRDDHARLPPELRRSETIARLGARRRGLGRRQQLRRDERGGAPDAPGDPARASAAARRAHPRHRLRGRARRRLSSDMPEVDRVVGNARKLIRASGGDHDAGPRPVRLGQVRASSRSRPAATIAAPSAPSGRRAGRAVRCRSRRSATRSRARSTAARRRSCSPASTSPTTMKAAWAHCASACSPPSPAEAAPPVVARQHRDRRALCSS